MKACSGQRDDARIESARMPVGQEVRGYLSGSGLPAGRDAALLAWVRQTQPLGRCRWNSGARAAWTVTGKGGALS